MTDTSLLERLAIHDLLCQFQSTFDLLDWDRMKGCLWEQLHVDYSSFRNEPPGVIQRETYIALRQAALSGLKMQHNFCNLQVSVCGDSASAQCNYQILRFRGADCRCETDFFHSYGRYFFGLTKRESEWRISRIRQELIANHGTPGLHRADLAKKD